MVLSVLHSIYIDKSDKDITIKLSISHKKKKYHKKKCHIWFFVYQYYTYFLWKESLNSVGHQIHQYQHKEQSPFYLFR